MNEEELMKIKFVNIEYDSFFIKLGNLFDKYDDVSVSIIYKDLGDRFYKTLDDCHGAPKGKIINMLTRERIDSHAGHKLMLLFPALKLLPNEEILNQTLKHFMLLHKLKCYETDLENQVKGLTSDNVFNRELLGLGEFRTMVAESERELDTKYQRLRFRPANDNESMGLAVLGDQPKPWRAVLVR